ncbi:MAG: DUF4291 family protein [Candidatus Methylacidiphilales bacterium]
MSTTPNASTARPLCAGADARAVSRQIVALYSIPVGLSWHVITEFVEEWIVKLEDLTPRVAKIHSLMRGGRVTKRHLAERIYEVSASIAAGLLLGT